MHFVIRLSLVSLAWASVHPADLARAQPLAIRPALEVQTGHQHPVAHAIFSADSRLLATADIRGSIRIWDTATGRQLRALSGHAGRVTGLAFSPDGRRLASAGRLGAARTPGREPALVKIWDVGAGREVHRLTGHRADVRDLAFSPAGDLLATAADDVRVWDTNAGRETERIGGRSAQTTVAFSPDGRVLAIREPSRLRLWTVGGGELAAFALGNFFGPRAVAFREDGARLAVPDGDKLKIIDPSTRAIATELAFHRESQVLGFADAHCVIRSPHAYEVWDISTGTRLRTLAPRRGSLDGPYHALSPDRRRLVVLNGPRGSPVTLRDLGLNRPPIDLAGRVEAAGAVAFSPGGALLATKSGRRFWVWDLRTGRPRLHGTSHGAEIDALAFAGDGGSIISGDLLWNLVQSDVPSGQVRNTSALKADTSTITHACSADGRWCVSGQQGRLDIRDVERWQVVHTFRTGVIRGVAISDDGAWVAAARVPRDVDLWDRQSGQHRPLTGHTVDVSRVAFAPGGRLLASADFGGSVRLWDTASGREVKAFDPGQDEGVTSLAFSPDGRTLATGGADETIWLWDVDTGRLRHVMKGHVDWVAKLAFSPDGKVLASGSGDGTARLWDVERGSELALLTAAKDRPDWLVVTPEGLFDGSAGARETLVAWRVGSAAHPAGRHLDDFFRPGLLAAVWRGDRPTPSAGAPHASLPPEVRIMKASGIIVRHARVSLRIRVQGAAAEVKLYRNLAQVASRPGVPDAASEYAFEVDLVPGENEIRAVAVSPAGASSHPDAVRLTYDAPAAATR
jgi:WD40 repeat protein